MKKYLIMIVSLILIVSFTGCGEKKGEIDDNQENNKIEEVLVDENNEIVETENSASKEDTVEYSYQMFFIYDDYSGVAPEIFAVKEDILEGKIVSEYVLEKMMDQKSFGAYLTPIPKETKLNEYTIDNGKIILDFSEEFETNMPSDLKQTKLHITAIVNTLTYLNEIETVEIKIDGNELKEINGMSLEEPLIYSEDFYFDK
jgi:hypothetical protein